nr:MAG TPA: hypothetical protein [Caudoviricetes sp.]DAS32168.1 MAG TPA: hypothetical protein [Caudoviricetes sp.]
MRKSFFLLFYWLLQSLQVLQLVFTEDMRYNY